MLVALLGIVLLLRALPLERPLQWLQAQVQELGWWGPVVFVAAFIVLTALLLPGWPLNVLAGAVFGPLWGGALTSLGSTLAAGVPFLISRYLARDWIVGSIRRHRKAEAVYEALGREANWKVVAAVRLSHALPFGLQNYLLGVTPVRLLPFLVTTWAVTLPGIFFVAYLGHVGAALGGGGEEPDGPWKWAARGGGLLVTGAAVYYIGRLVRRALGEHRGPAQDARPDEEPQADQAGAAEAGWPWLTLAGLGASLALLAVAAWGFVEKDRLREAAEQWFAALA